VRRSSRVQAGKAAFDRPIKAETCAEVAEQWLKRHVRAKGLRSEGEVTRLIKAHIDPAWATARFLDIKRK